jgi:hypothetical protein
LTFDDGVHVVESCVQQLGGAIMTSEETVLAALKDELTVLITIAKSDNRMVRNERDIVVRYAEERAKDKGLPFSEATAEHLHAWIKKQDPTTSQMRQVLERIAQTDKTALSALLEVVEIVAEIDGKVSDGEQRELNEAQAMIKAMM